MIIDNVSTVSLGRLDYLAQANYSRALAAFYQAGVNHHLPVVLWRYPNSREAEALVDFNGLASPASVDFTQQLPGFAFAPFVEGRCGPTLFIKAGLHLNQQGHRPFQAVSDFDNYLERNNKLRFLEAYRQLATGATPLDQSWVYNETRSEKNVISTEAEFQTLVQEAVDYIKTTATRKVVVSRAAEVELPPSFKPLAIFEALCDRYPHAFISLVSIPTVGTWIGASPEMLLNMNGPTLQTVALAGTQARHPEVSLAEVSWGDKEIEEQALVSDYIRDFFREQDVHHYREEGPRTVSAGNVVHLQTKFEVNLAEPGRAHLANQILRRLHPTSAVCGVPKLEALSFILAKERYNRAFYSGFLGPVHLDEQSRLYVNLRCMELKQNSALLYVGGGITQDSNPQAEWMETVLKSKTLLDVLQPEP